MKENDTDTLIYILAGMIFVPPLLAKFVPVTDPAEIAAAGFDGPFLDVTFDFVLAKAGR